MQKCNKNRLFNSSLYHIEYDLTTSFGAELFCLKENTILEQIGEAQFLALYLSPCDQEFLDLMYPGSVCQKDPNQVSYVLTNSYLRIISTIRYFDVEDFSESPVKTSVLSNSYYINKSTLRLATFAMKRDISIGSNSIFHESLDQFKYDTIQMDLQELSNIDRIDEEDYIIARMIMRNNINILERKVNNFLQLLSSIGGLLGLLFTSIRLLIQPFQEFQFNKSIIKKRYLIEMNQGNNLKKQSNDEVQFDLNEGQVNSYLEMIKKLKSRIPFIYTTKDVLVDNFEEIFYITYMIKHFRDFKMFKNMILQRYQKKLLPYFYDNLITSSYTKKQGKIQQTFNKIQEINLAQGIAPIMIELFANEKAIANPYNQVILNSLFNPQLNHQKLETLQSKMFVGILRKFVIQNIYDIKTHTQSQVKNIQDKKNTYSQRPLNRVKLGGEQHELNNLTKQNNGIPKIGSFKLEDFHLKNRYQTIKRFDDTSHDTNQILQPQINSLQQVVNQSMIKNQASFRKIRKNYYNNEIDPEIDFQQRKSHLKFNSNYKKSERQ
ncbi:UNKNOWN [Stylonychia lemnae]|uniref:Uncharacterized protein n=1 Tax=Stylonychia lemnae TaxID=5949 RepID=A0A078B4I3_STYLE|nr:UNKNOWN [Stylonychia lemnae]|eukprot:CDW88393.1 UNKNOWN [Stylonychia lemnae]